METLDASQIHAWTPTGTTLVTLGEQARLHAHLHNVGLALVAAEHPEIVPWKTLPVEGLSADNLPIVLRALHGKKVWALILTAPLKGPILNLLSPDFSKLAAQPDFNPAIAVGLGSADATSERIAATNLAMWRANGFFGTSTDGFALSRSLPALFANTPFRAFRSQVVIVLGTGAVGRAAVAEALSTGCQEVWLGGRTQSDALKALGQVVPSVQMQARVHSFGFDRLSRKLPTRGLVINTLPLEARSAVSALVPLNRFEPATTAYLDLITPGDPVQNPFWAQAQAMNLPRSLGHTVIATQVAHHIRLLTDSAPALPPLITAIDNFAG